MREILISTMGPILYIMAVLDAVAIGKMFVCYKEKKTDQIPLLTGILCIGLFYDALILALGTVLPFGGLLKALSQFRYILHLVLIPLLFPICAYSLTKNRKVIKIVWICSILIMVMGLFAGVIMKTEPRTVGTLNRYAQAEQNSVFASTLTQLLDIVPVFVMIIIGIYLFLKKKNPNMFFSGFFMLLFTLLGIFLGKDPGGDKSQSLMFYISMYGESLMVFFLYRFIQKNRD